MSSEEETLRPAFADAKWTSAAKDEDEFEVVPAESGPLSFQLSREGDTIVGRILNSGETIVLPSRPGVFFCIFCIFFFFFFFVLNGSSSLL